MGRLSVCLVMLAACAFDSSATGSGASSLGDGTTEGPDSADSSLPGTGSASASGSGASSSNSSGVTSATTNPSGADSDTGDDTGSPTSDPSGADSTTEVDPTAAGSSSSSTGPGFSPYGECPGGDGDCEGDQECIEIYDETGTSVIATVCAVRNCDEAGDCPDQSDGNVEVFCRVSAAIANWCGLDCSGDADGCPSGMDCITLGDGVQVCAWP